jgi:hypothetical protein
MYKFQLKNKEFITIRSAIRSSLNGKVGSLKYQNRQQNRNFDLDNFFEDCVI